MTHSFEILGQGPAIVLTQGWMMTRRVWERQRVLAKDFQLILWDFPQEGPSGAPLSLADCAKALQELLIQCDISEAGYVGWSMGMSVFWKYLEIYGGGRFKKLVNVEMLPKMDPEVAMVEAVEKSMRRDRERAIRKFIKRIFHNVGAPLAAPLIEDLIHDACALPLDSVLSVYRDMVYADFTESSSKFSGTQHLAFGGQGFYAGQEGLIRHFFPNDPLHWFGNSAHAPFWEEAEGFNDFLRKFLV
jgi:pimeloyl-ACP methyl ester carboxylesterase